MTVKKYAIVLFLIIASTGIYGQEAESIEYRRFPIKLSIGNHVVGFPFQNLSSSFNPAFSLGTEWVLNKNPKHSIIIPAQLGFIQNDIIGSSVNFDIGVGYRFTHAKGVFLSTNLNLGLLNQYHTRTIYSFNSTDGTYQEVKDTGTAASYSGFRLALGYDLNRMLKKPFSIGLEHHFYFQSPYFPIESFPIMPQSTTSITITHKFVKK